MMFSILSGISERFRFMNPLLNTGVTSTIIYLLMFAVCILFSLIIHECAHGFVALKCGDPTAKMMGRLTLDPRKHLDPIGTICMVLLRIGWAKPVPINPRNFRHYRRDYIFVSLAGICVNLLLFLVSTLAAVLLQRAYSERIAQYLWEFFILLGMINLSLAIFNLLPVPPLDGYRFVDQFIFRGSLSMNPRTMQIVHLVFLGVCLSGLLNNFLSNVNGTVFNAVYGFFLGIL